MIVWSNGRYHPLEEPAATLGNSGFLHGLGVFTTLRLSRGRPLGLAAHHARLARHGRELGLDLAPSPTELAEVISELTAANNIEKNEMRLRITLTREGPAAFLTLVPGPLPVGLDRWQAEGAAVITLGPRHQRTVLPHLKSLQYLPSVLAQEAAATVGAAEALILDEGEDLLEGAVSNVFLVEGRTLATPAADGRILAGLTRGRVLALAGQLGLEARETRLTATDLARAGEIFLTNCVREVVPVVGVDGRPVGAGLPGPVTRQLQQALAQAPF